MNTPVRKKHAVAPKDWWWKALALHAAKVPVREIAVQVGRSEDRVGKVLYGAWGQEQRREIEARAYEARMAEVVDPVVKFQSAGSEMADIMLRAAREETAPFKRAVIAEKNLALGGWVAVQKSLSVSVEAKVRDREAVPDHVLEAFANGGEVPPALRGLLLGADDEAAGE